MQNVQNMSIASGELEPERSGEGEVWTSTTVIHDGGRGKGRLGGVVAGRRECQGVGAIVWHVVG